MSIIIFMVVVIVVLALVCYGIAQLPMIQPVFKNILTVLAVLIDILAICHKMGWI